MRSLADCIEVSVLTQPKAVAGHLKTGGVGGSEGALAAGSGEVLARISCSGREGMGERGQDGANIISCLYVMTD